MAEFKWIVEKDPVYTFEFTRSEAMLLRDLVNDTAEGRSVMLFDDGSKYRPNEETLVRLKEIDAALSAADVYEVSDDFLSRWDEE